MNARNHEMCENMGFMDSQAEDRPLLRRAVMGLVVAVALGGFFYVFTGPTDLGIDQQTAGAVERVTPSGGNLDLRQVSISADLAPGYTGYLMLDGIEVAEDDLRRVEALNQVFLAPQPDSRWAELEPGPRQAAVVYWRIGESRDTAEVFEWRFSLH